MRKSPRDRRLEADYQAVRKLRSESTILEFEATGTPPTRYRMIFSGLGYYRNKSGEIAVTDRHEVVIELGAAYPRLVPNLAWQTPIFHPNISNNGVVCLGGYGTHWVPSLTLDEMCVMLWDMIRYKNYDTESPYNRDAALWAKSMGKHNFPVDQRSIRDRVSGQVSDDRIEVTPISQTPGIPSANSSVNDRVIEDGIEIIKQGGEDEIVFLD